MSVDRISEAELNAFVDGQLDPAGRLEVQDFLARHPDLAARVMADLGMRDSLRLAAPVSTRPHKTETIAAARRLSQSLRMRQTLVPLRRLAAGLAIFALGWSASLGWDRLTQAPITVAAGETSPPTSTFQAAPIAPGSANAVTVTSGAIIDASHLDPDKLGRAVSVKLPRVPAGWQVVGTRIVDSEQGAGIEVMLDTPEFGRLSLFARHTSDVAIILPTIAKGKGESTAYWQLVSDSYALTGHLARQPLEYAALELFQTLY